MPSAPAMTVTALPGIPMVASGDDLARLIADGLEAAGIVPRDGDILVIAQKMVSKSEGRTVALAEFEPCSRAVALAKEVGKDPRLVAAILRESNEVLRASHGVLIVVHRLGFVMANAGIDRSNVEDEDSILLLPRDPDASCAALKQRLDAMFDADLGIVINDSFGRPWRQGVVGVALGAAGLPALLDRRGEPDLFGRPLQVTDVAVADELAAAASIVMGQAGEGKPVVHVRGMRWDAPEQPASALIRPKHMDLFR